MSPFRPCWSCGSTADCTNTCRCAKCSHPGAYRQWRRDHPADYEAWLGRQRVEHCEHCPAAVEFGPRSDLSPGGCDYPDCPTASP